MTGSPELLPILSRGKHHRPEYGACIMEYVSVLAGERFSDHPACTHPAVAALARMVNDRIVDDGVRSELALLAPDLVGLRSAGPRTAHCVVAACLGAAASIGQLPPRTARRLANARLRSRTPDSGAGGKAPSRWQTWWDGFTAGAALRPALHQAAEMIDSLPGVEKQDARLRDLLRDTVADCWKLRDAEPSRRSSGRASTPAT